MKSLSEGGVFRISGVRYVVKNVVQSITDEKATLYCVAFSDGKGNGYVASCNEKQLARIVKGVSRPSYGFSTGESLEWRKI